MQLILAHAGEAFLLRAGALTPDPKSNNGVVPAKSDKPLACLETDEGFQLSPRVEQHDCSWMPMTNEISSDGEDSFGGIDVADMELFAHESDQMLVVGSRGYDPLLPRTGWSNAKVTRRSLIRLTNSRCLPR